MFSVMPSIPTSAPGRLLLATLFVSAEVKSAHGFAHPSSHAISCCHPSSQCSSECSLGRSIKRFQTNTCHVTRIYRNSLLRCAATASDNDGLSDQIIEAAEQKLPWEVAAERQSRPVLDLSGGGSGMDDSDLTLSDAASAAQRENPTREEEEVADDNDDEVDIGDWRTGSVWRETRRALVEKAILSDTADEKNDEDALLSKCPQLFRLPTEDVVESAKVLVDTIGMSQSAIAPNPTLLSYPAHLFPGAIEFLSNMMMLPQPTISNLCKTNPELLVGGLDGYIQEQSVKNALGSAGNALYGVSRSVANDVGKTMRDRKAKPKGL